MGCDGKIKYPNAVRAMRAAQHTGVNGFIKRKNRKLKPHPYHCEQCGGWHIGNLRKRL